MNTFLRRGLVLAAAGGGALLVLACGDDDKVCAPGAQQGCACSSGQGFQVCNSQGSGWSVCDCSGTGGSGGTSPSGPQVGGPCSEEGELVCGWDLTGTDDDLILECNGSTYEQAFECPSMQECTPYSHHTSVMCGTSSFYVAYGITGNPCAAEGSVVCIFDQTERIICEQGVWMFYEDCGDQGLKCQHVDAGWTEGTRYCPETAEGGCTVCAEG